MLEQLVKKSGCILDVGTGPAGSYFYQWVRDDSNVTGIDLANLPTIDRPNFVFQKMDVLNLLKCDGRIKALMNFWPNWRDKFDLVVADHIFEHVVRPLDLAQGLALVTKKDGYAHVAIPHPNNFTEKFYHLIHPEGGGHIVKITKQEMIDLITGVGFELIEYADIPDSWTWLEKLYDWRHRGIKYFSDEDLQYIAKTFRKELTPSKGYFYGGEYLFQKK